MNKDWILLKKETRWTFSKATWVPLRASCNDESGQSTQVGYVSDCFACGSVAFPPEQRERAEQLSWSDIGIGHSVQPYAYKDGYYASIVQYQYNDKEPIGVELVFEHPQHVVDRTLWILNPDLVVALRLIKEGLNWVRPEENFVVVAREVLEDDGSHHLIEIKREFLIDYLAARGLSLRISSYRQRVENVASIERSEYSTLENHQEQRDDGRFELRIHSLNDIFGGSWAVFRAWRTDVVEEEDTPVMGPESDDNTDFESSKGNRSGFQGVRVEGEFWRDEWIDHLGRSHRVRGDVDDNLPQFIVETDGTRMASGDLNNEDIGRWLWFRSSVVGDLLSHRGFSLKWYTSETGGISSTSGYSTHFGINDSDLITVYAYDVARLAAWEQHIWAAHNIVPEGKVSNEPLRLRHPGESGEIIDAQYDMDGTRIASGAVQSTIVRIWDSATGTVLHELAAETYQRHLSWSPNGRYVAAGGNPLHIWDTTRGDVQIEIPAVEGAWYQTVHWSSDGTRILGSSAYVGSWPVYVFDAQTGDNLLTFGVYGGFKYAEWSPDDSRIATGCLYSADGMCPSRIWDAETGKTLLILESSAGDTHFLEWSLDGTRLATAHVGGTATVWDATTGEAQTIFTGHDKWVTDVTWSPDGRRIVSGDLAGIVKGWNATTGAEVFSFQVPGGVVRMDWSPDGEYLVVAGEYDAPIIYRVLLTTEDLITYARECCVSRKLTQEKRAQFLLGEQQLED